MPIHRLPDDRIPVLLSAHEAELISQDAAAILDYLQSVAVADGAERVVSAVAFTLLRTRRLRRHRAVVRAADCAELTAGLCALASAEQHPLLARSSQNAARRTAFVFPGQGNQWPSMGAEAYRLLPSYRAEAQRCAEAFVAAGLPSPLSYLMTEDAGQAWSQIDIQGAQFTHAVSLAQVWRSCGVLPDITVGHSLGEVAAAYVAGTIALPDAVAIVAARGTVVGQLPGHYGMAVLGVGAELAEQLIAEIRGWLELSVVNSASSSVVSGDRDAVADIVRSAESNGIFARELAVDYPGHTSKLETLRSTFTALLPESAFLDAPVEFVSSVHGAGGIVQADTDFTDYWYRNLRHSVRFDDAVAMAAQRGAGTFVEMSADPTLLYALTELVEDAVIVGSGRRDEPIVDQLSANIAAAAVANPGYRWFDLAGVSEQQVLRNFPTAPMRTIHLWATPEPLPPAPSSALMVVHEEWQPWADSPPIPGNQPSSNVAIVAPRDSDDPLAGQLTAALAAHGCRVTSPDQAEIAILVAPPLMEPDVTAAAAQFCSGAAQLDYHGAVGPSCRRVWLVTTCAEQVRHDEPIALPAQAAMAAMHRSVGFEFPDQTFAHVDVPSRSLDAKTARDCVDVLCSEGTEVAVRDGRCYLRILRECAEPAPQAVLDTAALEHVVITGGSGTIGLRYARHCVERGARRVTLLSRRGVDRPELERMAEGYQAQMCAPACDISDPAALSVVADEYAGDGASLLIHAAGVARFGPHDQFSGDDLGDMFSAKVVGLAQFVEIWPLRPDVRILLCSSISGVWGGYGHAAYAASNRMLDTLAAQQRARGLDCIAVRWGLWQGTTIAETEEIARIERSGLIAMDPAAAVDTSFSHHRGDPLIFAADLQRLRAFFESQGATMPFTSTGQGDDVSAPDSESADQISVTDLVRSEIAAAFSLDGAEPVDLSAALVDLGADSMLALDLRDRLRRRTGISVPAGRMLGGMTGAELIDCLQSTAQPPAADQEPTSESRTHR